ncbi:outer membrane receptor for ferric coprogen and ferric-rhodotorulic acid [Acinetobacter calcoaceticus]|uniref:Outer membrane receptor for ferric coprogen and ferric-rhodotorulic acid n=1 Tax=Acinetobacter calcoaceticus TaxID=471 RepID=A0A4R1XT34_ACICA|nr:outer membrane receptor for ferric coprogen and ferric-rhodotorulic acid [Acinetobacter calcoaceticus]
MNQHQPRAPFTLVLHSLCIGLPILSLQWISAAHAAPITTSAHTVTTTESVPEQSPPPLNSSASSEQVTQLATITVSATADHNQALVGKSAQALKEIPQSVTVLSREQIEQQGLKTLDDVMLKTTGVTREQTWLNNNYSSRGLKITNIRYDGGGASSMQGRSNNADMAQYDSVALLRGADGLFGAGEAGGVINLNSKRPQADPAIVGSISAGSWNNYRAEVDATGALNQDQSIQGRVVAVFQDQDFFYKPTQNRREMLYTALNFELSPETTWFTGASYQRDKTDAFNASLPRWEDGADLGLPREHSFNAPWGWMKRENISIFSNLVHQFNDDWKAQLNIRHNIGDDSANNAEIEGAVAYQDRQSEWWRYQEMTEFKETSYDLNLQGSFEFLNQRHDLILGLDHVSSQKDHQQNWIKYGKGDVFDPVAPPEWDFPAQDWAIVNQTDNSKTGLYGSLRIRPVENLALIAGGRYVLKDKNVQQNRVSGKDTLTDQDKLFIPYFGLVYDLTQQISIYASSAEIYKSQANLLDVNQQPLDPITGRNYELGIKTSLMDDQLNASFALYQVKKTGEGTRISGPFSSPCCYIGSGSLLSQGFDIELTGMLSPDWNISAGYTYNDNENKANSQFVLNSYTPKHLLKIWSHYRMDAVLPGLSIGGGVTAQSKNFKRGKVTSRDPITGAIGDAHFVNIEQPSYAVWSMRVGYEIDPHWDVALNLDNLFDKRYYSTIGDASAGNFYGEPRSVLLTLRGKY